MKRILVLVVLSLGLICPSSMARAANDSLKTMNIRISPLGLLIGVANLDWDIGISDTITLGPTITGFRRTVNDSTYSGGALGVRVNIYLGHDRFTDSWIIGPELSGVTIKSSTAGFQDVTLSGTLLAIPIAYQWVWPGGFNLDLGGVVGFYSFPSTYAITDVTGNTESVSAPYSGAYVGLEFTLGYAF